eukprot:2631923-Ditylum_brightwellii.AAC.1
MKKAGVFKIHRLLCTLHKLESEVNILQREAIALRLMTNAEKHHHIDNDQHRGCNKQNAIGIVIGKSFTFDMFHFQRANFRCTDCNAKACYNRIIPL